MKYKQRYKQPDSWSLKNHWLVGYEWLITGSKGDTYYVEATPQGFKCSCYGFTFYGKCKHVREVINRIETVEVPKYQLPRNSA